MVRCSLFGCKSDSDKKIPGLSFHSFPSKPELRSLWIKVTGRNNWAPKKSSKMCSIHFPNSALMKVGNKTFLHPEAIPVKVIVFISRPVADHFKPEDYVIESYEKDFVEDNIPEKHTDFTCDSCMGDIIGFRYSCVQCARFEQCAACEARRAHRHHHVLRLPAPARGPSNEVDNVIAAIRAKIDVLENAMKQNSATWYNDVVIKKEEFEVEVDTERHTEPEEVSFEEPTAKDVVPKAEPEYPNETTEELVTPEIDSDIYGTKCRIKKERDLSYEDDKEVINA